jgi:hypothetical protein
MTETARLFSSKAAYYTERGYGGADIFEKLASDADLPMMLTFQDSCAIESIALDTARKRRQRGEGPSFFRDGNVLRIQRGDYCRYLASRFIKPSKK